MHVRGKSGAEISADSLLLFFLKKLFSRIPGSVGRYLHVGTIYIVVNHIIVLKKCHINTTVEVKDSPATP